jgi:hypothetical protein
MLVAWNSFASGEQVTKIEDIRERTVTEHLNFLIATTSSFHHEN